MIFDCVLLISDEGLENQEDKENNGGGYDNWNQVGISSPLATVAPAGGNNMSNLLGSLMNNAGSGSMANLVTSLVAQALQNKPGGMLIGGNHFGGQGSAPMGGQFNNSGPRGGGGYMDRSGGRDDYRVSIFFRM